jgi:hypothetical protein
MADQSESGEPSRGIAAVREEEKTVDVTVQPRSQSLDKSVEVAEESTDDDGRQDGEKGTPKLPFSNVRCLAIVATLAGSSFMNVSGEVVVLWLCCSLH